MLRMVTRFGATLAFFGAVGAWLQDEILFAVGLGVVVVVLGAVSFGANSDSNKYGGGGDNWN